MHVGKPPPDRITDACENITLTQTSFAGGQMFCHGYKWYCSSDIRSLLRSLGVRHVNTRRQPCMSSDNFMQMQTDKKFKKPCKNFRVVISSTAKGRRRTSVPSTSCRPVPSTGAATPDNGCARWNGTLGFKSTATASFTDESNQCSPTERYLADVDTTKYPAADSTAISATSKNEATAATGLGILIYQHNVITKAL